MKHSTVCFLQTFSQAIFSELTTSDKISINQLTGILKLLIDDDEDLINEESQESCDQNHLKVS